MTAIWLEWGGETPYDNDLAQFRDNILIDAVWELRPTAYRTAMNSEVVRGLYETLKWAAPLVMDEWEGTQSAEEKRGRLYGALEAYEKGMR